MSESASPSASPMPGDSSVNNQTPNVGANIQPAVRETQVRFAVVMYGGVSLAIYINGVAQELLKMVRATAKDAAALSSTEKIYRKLSHILGDPQHANDFRQWADDAAQYRKCIKEGAHNNSRPSGKFIGCFEKELQGLSQAAPGQSKKEQIVEAAIDQCDPLREPPSPAPVRFIVDIISGTSAGGINGIFLAKALANDQQIDKLKTLWIEEGDIALLLNDRQSVKGLSLANQKPPQSLLNSRRMYLKLLEALDGMEQSASPTTPAQGKTEMLPDELDLFITTTDIGGVEVALELADKVVYERRYRNVFHFKYDLTQPDPIDKKKRNDFRPEFNPFLAFAARCTSSFPFAFEPMALADIDEVTKVSKTYRKKVSGDKRWEGFFTDTQFDFVQFSVSSRPLGASDSTHTLEFL